MPTLYHALPVVNQEFIVPTETEPRMYMGWTVRLTAIGGGWWRAAAVYLDDNGLPRTATVYDASRDAAWDALIAHISDTEDALCQSA